MEAEQIAEKTPLEVAIDDASKQEEGDDKKVGREYFKSKYAILFGYSGKGYCGL